MNKKAAMKKAQIFSMFYKFGFGPITKKASLPKIFTPKVMKKMAALLKAK